MHVVVGISGGVDSAVAAYLLREEGHTVSGVFMQNWQPDHDDPYCSVAEDLADAKAVCNHLKIPLSVVNFSKQYWQKVFKFFLDEYAKGRTPNPDVFCNKEIKFKAFLEHAIKELNADFIATGHYARIGNTKKIAQAKACGYNFEPILLKGIDQSKDQSYFLCLLNQQQLAKAIFPLGDKTKNEVREIAQTIGLPNHAKKDSTGICFIGERKFKKFLQEFLLAQPGEIRSLDGKPLGKHDGLMFYTIGQRKGLGIGGKKDAEEKPWFVVNKDIKNNILYVAQGQDNPALFSASLTCSEVNWINNEPELPFTCEAQIRYRSKPQPCEVIKLDNNHYQVNFEKPQWAVTPGQIVAFYQEEQCLGGGIIN
jgi:tRNA-specific 2-thiouridylase